MFLSKLKSCHFTLMHDKYKLASARSSHKSFHPKRFTLLSMIKHSSTYQDLLSFKKNGTERSNLQSCHFVSCQVMTDTTSTHSFRWLLSSSLRSNQRISLHEEMHYISDKIILAWYNISICNRHGETLWIILRCLFRRLSIRGLSKRSSLTRDSKRKKVEEPEPIILRSHWTFTAVWHSSCIAV